MGCYKEPPTRDHPSPWTSLGCVVSSPPWTMGPWPVAMWCSPPLFVLHGLDLVSCPTWSRHLCNSSVVAMLSLLGSDGLWDYVQLVLSNVFGSSPFIFVFLSNSCMFSIAVYYFGQVVDCNSTWEHYAWLWVHAPRWLAWVTKTWVYGMCCCHQGKTTVLVLAGTRIVYFMQSSFNSIVCCFEFTLWVGFTT